MGLDEVQAQGDLLLQHGEVEEKIIKLWVTRMSDSDYLKKLVEFLPRRLAEVIEKEGANTG